MQCCPFKQHFHATIFGFLSLLMLVAPSAAQTVSFGGKVGTPLLDPLVLSNPSSSVADYTFSRQRYTVGPTFEFGLPYRLSVEADALYRPLHYTSFPFGFNTFQATTSANYWELPVLLKARLWSGMIRPYGNGGVSFRHAGGTTTFTSTAVSNSPVSFGQQQPAELVHSWVTGYVAGGGVDFSYGVIHVSPEVRYTRWGTPNFSSADGVLSGNRNSVDLLVGVTFTNERQ